MWLEWCFYWAGVLLGQLTGCHEVSGTSLDPLETSRHTRWPLASVRLGSSPALSSGLEIARTQPCGGYGP